MKLSTKRTLEMTYLLLVSIILVIAVHACFVIIVCFNIGVIFESKYDFAILRFRQ